MKKLSFIQRTQSEHWVGDGFPVRNIFSYDDVAEEMSPFLLLDYAGPKNFPATSEKRGVGEHPHRGFETVTIVYDGEVEHRDSSGGGGKIGPGEVQWMTAASGVVHEEYHGREYAKRGGPFEVVQLWVNLPKKDKMTKPRYQGITRDQISEVAIPGGKLRVIAGSYESTKGPALTFSPMNIWDIRAEAGKKFEFKLPNGFTTGLLVLRGRIKLPSGEEIRPAEMAVMEREGTDFSFEATEESVLLLLNGQPLNEPIVGAGPFVMNTEAEIRQAYMDYRSGKMGHLS
ncbi:MAG: pirin family protein [Bdellovibrionales bacterium]|nr:pirin family protein [Bdellovibrionales bacterium]